MVQLTPTGSPASIIFGSDVTAAAPGTVAGLYLVVDDIEAARDDSPPVASTCRRCTTMRVASSSTRADHRVPGPDPDRAGYASFASFSDPDGTRWTLQEVRERRAGR